MSYAAAAASYEDPEHLCKSLKECMGAKRGDLDSLPTPTSIPEDGYNKPAYQTGFSIDGPRLYISLTGTALLLLLWIIKLRRQVSRLMAASKSKNLEMRYRKLE